MSIPSDRFLSSTGQPCLTRHCPNEFVLVKFATESNTREVMVSLANACGAQTGAIDKAARGLKVEKLGRSGYKLTPRERYLTVSSI